jgi:mannose-6-phosphate isomerase-like protein (cupin superfamily)
MMTLRPGDSSDSSPSNEHRHSEQWLYVVSGVATVRIGMRRASLRSIKLKKNSLLVIEKGELHQITNSGRRPLVTINFYIPPAYENDGKPKQ